MKGEVTAALSRWTFGQATPRDGDEAARSAQMANLERKFDEWVAGIIRERLRSLERLVGSDHHGPR